MQEALDWGYDKGITFDLSKSELKHFTRGHMDNNPTAILNVSMGTHNIQEMTGPLRWLGVFYDQKLKFRQHTSILSAKALTVANALRSLGKTMQGVPPIFLQWAIAACVLKKCYFAAETWWPGRVRIVCNRRISNQVKAHLCLLRKQS